MLKLTPKTNEIVDKLVEDEESLKELADGFGSPLNIMLPENFSKNIQAFRDVFDEHGIEGKIFFAHKANKSESLIAQGRKEDIGIDVASENELKNALSKGFKGEEILATGPKNRDFLRLAVHHGCILHIDSLEELEKVEEYSQQFETETDVLIRLNNFVPRDRKAIQKHSRFGIPVDKKEEIIQNLDVYNSINFQGFAFHLDTANMRKKAIALQNIFDLVKEFHSEGYQTQILDIGGGMKVNYLESGEEWSKYLEAIQESVAGKREGITWNSHSFGLRSENQSVKGSVDLYSYYNETAKDDYLCKLLSGEIPGYERTFRDLLRDYMIELYIEPGRALLDLAGITVGKVNFVKEDACGEKLVGLDMNKSNINPQNWELMVDPYIIHRDEDREELEDGVFFVGNLCLESDFIYKHKTFLDKKPEEDDLVVFVNTAAYHMDFGESRTIQHDTADKVAVYGDNNWKKDELYTGEEILK